MFGDLGVEIVHQHPKGGFLLPTLAGDFGPARSAHGLPTVEELNALLHRIAVVERDVSSELQGQINAEIARLKSCGVKFAMDTMPTPICHFAIICDPDGNKILIHKRKVK